MNTNLIQGIDQDIAGHRITVEHGAVLQRLQMSREFKQVVTDGYLNKEAVRLVRLKAHPSMQSPENQRVVTAQIDAIGCFYQYLSKIHEDAEQAKKSMDSAEQTREEILSEDR